MRLSVEDKLLQLRRLAACLETCTPDMLAAAEERLRSDYEAGQPICLSCYFLPRSHPRAK